MKKSYVKLLILEFLIIVFFFVNSFLLNIIDSSLIFNIFLAFILLILIVIVGFEKDRFVYKKDVFQIMLIYILAYFLITYTLGIFIGLERNAYSGSIALFIKYGLPSIFIIIFEELIRYIFVIKLSNKKSFLLLTTFLMILLELLLIIPKDEFNTLSSFLDYTALIFLPIISKNVLLTYLTYKVGYKIPIAYRLIFDTFYVYIIPLYVNFGDYLEAVIKFVFPLAILITIYKLFQRREFEKNIGLKYKKISNVLYVILIVFLVPMVYLVSGYGKYTLVAIASNSMKPTYARNDVLIYQKEDDCSKLKKGDILVFKYNSIVLAHRIVNIVHDGKSCYIQTKGDNNRTVDGFITSQNEIVGIVKEVIPMIGAPTIWLSERF